MKQASCMNPTSNQNWRLQVKKRHGGSKLTTSSGSVAALIWSSFGGLRELPSYSTHFYLVIFFAVTVAQVGSSMQKPLDAALLWLAVD